MSECLFCRICSGEASATRVYEDDSAVVIVYTRDKRPGEAEATLERFMRDAGPALGKMLDDTRARR